MATFDVRGPTFKRRGGLVIAMSTFSALMTEVPVSPNLHDENQSWINFSSFSFTDCPLRDWISGSALPVVFITD
jgi:hypothetical protein